MESHKAIKLEINLQDTEVPIYTDFREIKEGYVVLFGNNKKSLELRLMGYPFGKIEDANGVEVTYVLSRNPSNPDTKRYEELIEKAKTIPVGLQFWLFGSYTPIKKGLFGRRIPSRVLAYNLGRKEEFIRSDPLG